MTVAILVEEQAGVLIQGITGREASMVTGHCLAYGTRVVAGVTPGKGGREVHGVPVYDTVKTACHRHSPVVSVVYVPPGAALDAVLEAVDAGLQTVVVVTENVPVHDALRMVDVARQRSVRLVGPNSVGVISPGLRLKLGAIGGDIPDRCFADGRIGIVSRSGGMTAETAWMLKRGGFGVSTAVSIGGDAVIGTTPRELLSLFENDPETDAVVMFSEPGTSFEEDAAELVAGGGFTKPLVVYVAGRFTASLPEGTVFGHAGAFIKGTAGRPSTKMELLRRAGALVADQYDDIIPLLVRALGQPASAAGSHG